MTEQWKEYSLREDLTRTEPQKSMSVSVLKKLTILFAEKKKYI